MLHDEKVGDAAPQKEAAKDEKKEEPVIPIKDIFGESLEDKCDRIREASPYGGLMSWKLIQVIVKQGCDLRQEQFATQLISQFDQIFKQHKVRTWLMPYEIICTGPDSGLLQCVPDALSLDSLNQKLKKHNISGLAEFFSQYFRDKTG